MQDKTDKINPVVRNEHRRVLYRVDAKSRTAFDAPYELRTLRTVVGRDPEVVDVHLDSGSVSRSHFSVEFQPKGYSYKVVDQKSSNGLYVNGTRVREKLLKLNDVIRVGDVLLIFAAGPARKREPKASAPPIPGDVQELVVAPAFFPGISEEIREVNRTLGLLEATGRALVIGEAGLSKADAVRSLADWMDPGRAPVVVHGSSLTESNWEEVVDERLREATKGEQANHHFLHIDEIHLLPPVSQERLRHLLQHSEGQAPFARNVVATTSLAPGLLAGAGALLPALIAELTPPRLVLTPLCERRQDIAPILFDALTEHAKGASLSIAVELMETLLLQPWPGNIREIRRLAALLAANRGLAGELDLEHTPPRFGDVSGKKAGPIAAEAIALALSDAAGNVSEAARTLGVSRRHLYRLMDQHKVRPAGHRKR